MSEWLEKIVDWQEDILYRLQVRFGLSDLQVIYLAFLLGAFLVWIF